MFRAIRLTLAVLLSVMSVVAIAQAESVQQARVAGHDKMISLYFSDSVERLTQAFAAWEHQLEARGVRATFYLAAGDLRRAVLHTAIEGPGGVEILLHLENRSVKPLRQAETLKFLQSNGVELAHDLHAIFGDSKKIDLFVKDSNSLRRGLPYTGEFGFFENMGDTSLNELRYSPKLGLIEGAPANLAALAKDQITFIEIAKSAKLPEPKKITGLEATTSYPSTILRLALRSIRLETEILLSPNPNHLAIDESFSDVRRGFELFFRGVPDAEVAKYAMDEASLEQFSKIFRNRDASELKRIREHLRSEHRETLRLMIRLGLDVDLLVDESSKTAAKKKLEFRAVMKNARYEILRPFINPDLSVKNPFKDPRAEADLLRLALSARGPSPKGLLPSHILARYSPKLYAHVQAFDELSFEQKRAILGDSIRALQFFAKEATKRIRDEKTFAQEYLKRFPLADAHSLQPDDQRSLLEFILAEESRVTRGADLNHLQEGEAAVFNRAAFDAIEASVRGALSEGKKPVIVVDLDRTVFNGATRVLSILEKYDWLHGTRFFAQLSLLELDRYSLEEFLYLQLSRGEADFSRLKERVAEVIDFVQEERWNEEHLLKEQVNLELVGRLRHWQSQGAELLYLTARTPFLEEITRQTFAIQRLPKGALVLNRSYQRAAEYKLEQLKSLKASRSDVRIIAFLDDDKSNVNKIRTQMPEVLSFRAVQKYEVTAKGARWALALIGSDADFNEVYAVRPVQRATERESKLLRPVRSCEVLFATAG